MKEKFIKITKWFSLVAITLALTFIMTIGVSADEVNVNENEGIGGEYTEILPDETTQSGENSQNIFDRIYSELESNADKIFSVLAFVGTLVVGVGYKSGLLPLLRDALSKLKSAVDGVKADGELSKALTESKMNEIIDSVNKIELSLDRMEERLDDCDLILAERESMRTILLGQVDMLYAIFMSSALPQYQKDEIGIKIQEMREELASYENAVEN